MALSPFYFIVFPQKDRDIALLKASIVTFDKHSNSGSHQHRGVLPQAEGPKKLHSTQPPSEGY